MRGGLVLRSTWRALLAAGLVGLCLPGCKDGSTLTDGAVADLTQAQDQRTGDLAPAPARGYLALLGGPGIEPAGTAHAWSDAVYGWIVAHAGPSGRVVILSPTAADGTLPAYFQRLGATSAETVVLDSRPRADDNQVAASIEAAGAVFIGGPGDDPAQLVGPWAGTRALQAIASVYRRGGLIGGAGAGAQLLGDIVYDGRAGQLAPAESLQDGLSPKLTFSEDVIPFADSSPAGAESGLLPRVLVEPSFTAHGRLPRLAGMLAARLTSQPQKGILGVGIDEKTALLVGPDLVGTVRGQGAVTLLRASPTSSLRLSAGRPPIATDLHCDVLTEGFAVDLRSGDLRAQPPSAESLPAAPPVGLGKTVRLDGSQPDSAAGADYLKDVSSDPLALQHGTLTLAAGRNELPPVLLVPQTFADAQLVENRVGGALFGLASPQAGAGRVGLLLPGGASVRAVDGLTLEFVAEGAPTQESAAVVVDSRTGTLRDRSTYVVDPAASKLPRQSVALVGLRVHVLGLGARFDLVTNQIVLPPP